MVGSEEATLHEHDYFPEVVVKIEQIVKTEKEGSSICRVCLQEGDIPIHGNDRYTDVSQELNALAGICVCEDDGFPKHLCESCYSQLQGAIQLRSTAQHSEIILQQQRQRKNEPENCENKSFKEAGIKITDDGHQNTGKNQFTKKSILESIVKNNLRASGGWGEPKGVAPPFVYCDPSRTKCTSRVKNEPQEHGNKSVTTLSNLLKKYNLTVKRSSSIASQNLQIVKKKDKINKNETITNSIGIENKSEIKPKTCETKPKTCETIPKTCETIPKKCETKPKTCETKPKMCETKHKTYETKQTSETKPKTCIIRSNRSRSQKNPQNILMTTSDIVSIAKRNEILKRIRRKEHPAKKLYCTQCEIYFDSVEKLQQHKLTEEHKNPKECPICHENYSSWIKLKEHEVVHTLEKKYICDICGKVFSWKQSLDNHIATHSLNLPFHCIQCPYKGRNKIALRRHMLTHTGEKPHQCDECEKRFATTGHVKSHKLTHHKSGYDFNCDTCSRGYHYKSHLEKHIRADHLGIMDHVCDLCGKAFGLRHKLMRHTYQVHKRQKLVRGKPLYLIAEQQGISADTGATIDAVN